MVVRRAENAKEVWVRFPLLPFRPTKAWIETNKVVKLDSPEEEGESLK